jgi:hypothetical protein
MTGGKEMKIMKQDLLDEKKYFFIQHVFQSKTPQQQQKESQQTK